MLTNPKSSHTIYAIIVQDYQAICIKQYEVTRMESLASGYFAKGFMWYTEVLDCFNYIYKYANLGPAKVRVVK
jgi:hypothetical protein